MSNNDSAGLPPARWGLWMNYIRDDANGWTAKQTSLLDAIDALSYATAGPPDCSSTSDLAALVGCTVDEAWHALVLTDYAIPSSDPCNTASDLRGGVTWSIPEADWDSDDDEWYERRIDAARRLDQPNAVAFWASERDA